MICNNLHNYIISYVILFSYTKSNFTNENVFVSSNIVILRTKVLTWIKR